MSQYQPKASLRTTSKIIDSERSLKALAKYNQRMLGLPPSETQSASQHDGLDKLESMINDFQKRPIDTNCASPLETLQKRQDSTYDYDKRRKTIKPYHARNEIKSTFGRSNTVLERQYQLASRLSSRFSENPSGKFRGNSPKRDSCLSNLRNMSDLKLMRPARNSSSINKRS